MAVAGGRRGHGGAAVPGRRCGARAGPWAWSLLKTLAVLVALVCIQRRFPMVRADRYVEFAWVVLVPLAVLQALVPALVVLNR